MDLREKLLERLIKNQKILDCYSAQEEHLLQALQQLAVDKKSGSILVSGPRGAGKTTLIESCFEKSPYAKRITRANLNGVLQTSDAAAIKKLAEQLGGSFEEDPDSDVSVSSMVLDLLRKVKRPLAIIVEEFDRFAIGRSALKQCLLYSLLDATYNETAPLLVIGISSNLDVMNLLEKRTRSRISQRQLHMSNNWDFVAYLDFTKALLRLDDEKKFADVVKIWNSLVDETLQNENVRRLLRQRYDTDPSLQYLRQYLISIIALVKRNEFLSPDIFQEAASQLVGREIILRGFSEMEMCLVAAASHYVRNYDDAENLNFERIYKDYLQAARNDVHKAPLFQKPVMLQAFDSLCNLGIFASNTTRNRMNALRQFQPVKLQIDTNMIKSHIDKHKYPTYFKEWI